MKENQFVSLKLSDFNGNWPVYKSYLAEHGQLHRALSHNQHDWRSFRAALNGRAVKK